MMLVTATRTGFPKSCSQLPFPKMVSDRWGNGTLQPVGKHNLSDRAIEQRQEPRGKARTRIILGVSENGMFAAGQDGRNARQPVRKRPFVAQSYLRPGFPDISPMNWWKAAIAFNDAQIPKLRTRGMDLRLFPSNSPEPTDCVICRARSKLLRRQASLQNML